MNPMDTAVLGPCWQALAVRRQSSHGEPSPGAATGPLWGLEAAEAYEIIASGPGATVTLPTADRCPQIRLAA